MDCFLNNKSLTVEYKSIFNITGGLLICLMCIFPNAAYIPKIFLIFILLIVSTKTKIYFSKNVLILWGIYLLVGWYGILNGLLNVTEHPFNWITTVIIWPSISLPIISHLRSDLSYLKLTRLIFFIHSFIVIYDLLIAFSVILGFSIPIIYSQKTEIFSYYPEVNASRMNLVNLNVINFTFPIILLCWITKFKIKVNSILMFVMILLTFTLLFLSGRRSVMMLSLLIIPIAIIFSRFLPYKHRKALFRNSKLLVISIGIILLYITITNPGIIDGFINTISKAFDSGQEPIKFAQQKMLLSHFYENPLFGAGVGKEFYEPFPGRMIFNYQYELQYHLILAQMGIVGLLLYLIVYLGILFYGLYLATKNKDIIFLFYLIGYFFILISHATNPVLCSFDLMLPFFLCLAKINSNSLQLYKNKNE